MHTSQATAKNWQRQLQQLSPDLQEVIIQIHEDSQVLRLTFDTACISPATINAIIGAAFINLLTETTVREGADDDYIDQIRLVYSRITEAVTYMEQRMVS